MLRLDGVLLDKQRWEWRAVIHAQVEHEILKRRLHQYSCPGKLREWTMMVRICTAFETNIYSRIMVKFTFVFLVGDFLKSTRHRYMPPSESRIGFSVNTAGFFPEPRLKSARPPTVALSNQCLPCLSLRLSKLNKHRNKSSFVSNDTHITLRLRLGEKCRRILSHLWMGELSPCLYQITSVAVSPATGGVILHESLATSPATAVMFATLPEIGRMKRKWKHYSYTYVYTNNPPSVRRMTHELLFPSGRLMFGSTFNNQLILYTH